MKNEKNFKNKEKKKFEKKPKLFDSLFLKIYTKKKNNIEKIEKMREKKKEDEKKKLLNQKLKKIKNKDLLKKKIILHFLKKKIKKKIKIRTKILKRKKNLTERNSLPLIESKFLTINHNLKKKYTMFKSENINTDPKFDKKGILRSKILNNFDKIKSLYRIRPKKSCFNVKFDKFKNLLDEENNLSKAKNFYMKKRNFKILNK